MLTFGKTFAVAATATVLTTSASAQTAWQHGATPYIEIKNEPAPKLIVHPPIPEGLPKGLVWIQYHAENVRIGPVLGEGALQASPRVGHLHIPSMTCHGCGRIRVAAIPSTYSGCRPAHIR